MRKHPLTELRELTGLNMTQLAESLDITVGRISQIEGGDGGQLSVEKALKCLSAYRVPLARLGITLEDLLRGNRQDGDGAAA